MELIQVTPSFNFWNESYTTWLPSDIFNDDQKNLFVIVNFVCVCGVICLFGAIANIINMTVFLKQGFKLAVNISFFGLAISDLCCVLTMIWQGMCLNPLISNRIPWVASDFVYLTAAWPHNISGRITSYITIYVTLERYLCITFPLKVKGIFTPARTTVVVVLLFLINIISLLPEYATSYLGWNYFQDLNATLLSISYREGRENVVGLTYIINCVLGAFSFVAVIVVTCCLVIKLKKTSEWRKEVTSKSCQGDAMSTRDRKMIKMITAIACTLIACYCPGIVVCAVSFMEPEFNLGRRYANICYSMWSICGVFQALNSSINIVLYYNMSTKYRDTFHMLYISGKCCGTSPLQAESSLKCN